MTVLATRTPEHPAAASPPDSPAGGVDVPAPDGAVVPEPAGEPVTVFTAEVVETRGLLARIAVQLNPYDVRELTLCLRTGTLRVVVAGAGFDAGRVAARLDKIVGVLEVSHS